ncbi:uncharacterized protein LOC111327652 [Stylophora pistillata]|uniref:uncharacterized protein LOC111327652 n=1 Tax=Stylophora pistillata TaxID=50429 RepID=UPI000C0508E3|nr:uncharacterized protein LOC111327652 [Stylophora pistillata]
MEREKLYTALFLASLLRVPQSNSAENFRRDGQSGVNYAHFVKNPFQRLNTAVVDSLIVSRTLECTYRCVNHQECYSVNFATASLKCELLNADKFQNWADVVYSETWDHYNIKCELLNADKFQNWADVVYSETWDHYNIKSPCMSNPCQNGTLFCRPNYDQDDYQCVGKPGYSGIFYETERFVNIFIRSEGYDDPGKTSKTGVTYIRVNGTEYSPKRRGDNVVVVDGATGSFLKATSFDTHGDRSSGTRMLDYLNGLSGNKIVLVAVQDQGSHHMSSAIAALKRLGAHDPVQLKYRESFALAGYAGGTKPSWITQKQASKGRGPSEFTLKISLPTV